MCDSWLGLKKKFVGALLAGAALLLPVLLYGIQGLRLKPGFNLFSPQQDVEVGQKSAEQADHQLALVRDSQVLEYVNHLGRYLAGYAPWQPEGTQYDWTFKVVNSPDINAFALPGGFVYVNRGAIEAAQDEAQIAGVIAHEEGHVMMRHGTHQASEMMLAQAPLSVVSGLLGNGVGGALARIGIGFGANSVFLHNSRSAESQADQLGTYLLYHAGYDPHAMAQFFGIIQQKYPQQTLQFFSDHPNPPNRIRAVDQEIPSLGPPRSDWKTDSPQFQAVKRRLQSMPPAPKPKRAPS